ncbi:hypothetical protein [Planococcus versutus]|uniref:Uncharacterized protein n=1 Tax=Planococcus versutus TaxID=1302659 RepID=A0A1B1S5G4_9BACL|nr:hypothetical protein [Planococcus versutus]ANU28436.1 hypothetical protein I858_015710 [Planococcus versutus]
MNKQSKYTNAQLELKRVLGEQQTVSVTKLLKLLNSLNVSLDAEKNETSETTYLKGEIRARDKKLKLLNEQIKRLKNK